MFAKGPILVEQFLNCHSGLESQRIVNKDWNQKNYFNRELKYSLSCFLFCFSPTPKKIIIGSQPFFH